MRDPLAWVPIRYKLPLGFLCICLVAFGIGGVVITQTAGRALAGEIRLRLDEQAKATALAVERRLELFGRRVEDFASDGYIRVQTEALTAAGIGPHAPDAAAAGVERGLRRHLLDNKLPLVEAFVDAALIGPNGRTLLGVMEPPPHRPEPHRAEGTSFGALLDPTVVHPYPTFAITTPLRSLTGGRRIGTLVILVRADTWAAGLPEPEALKGPTPSRATLVDPAGRRLPLVSGTVAGEGGVHDLSYETPILLNGWTCLLDVDLREAMQPIAKLRSRYLLIGAALLLVVAIVLFFPMRFLLRPLARIAEAARSIAGGDFKTRVESESRDEIGELSRAFNIMADAVEERTGQLERTASTLARREKDIRFERDRLNAVIHAMDDGLFILGPDGKVLLANAAARPLVRGLGEGGRRPDRVDCHREKDVDRDCLRCLVDPKRRIRSCVVHLDSRIYEVQVTHLPVQGRRSGGRICVSREITGRIAQADRQAHQERMAVLGEIAAVMAHELNNPLAAISMFSQMLEGELPEDSEQKESATVIRRNTETCKRSIRGLLDLAAQATPEPGSFDVHEMLDDALDLLRPVYRRAGIVVRTAYGAEEPVTYGDELQLRQVVVNLVMNAIQAITRADGEIVVETEDAGDAIEVRIRDKGPGVPVDLQGRIFEPFFTTKPPGTGTGLGLPTSRRVVEAHGGRLDLIESTSGGSTFRLRLPREGRISSWRTSVRLTEGLLTEGSPTEGLPTEGSLTERSPTEGLPTEGLPTAGRPAEGVASGGDPRV